MYLLDDIVQYIWGCLRRVLERVDAMGDGVYPPETHTKKDDEEDNI